MKRTILIMAQGEQRRLAHLGKPKQLLEVNGEPILRRTLRLLRELDQPQPLIVAREWAIEESEIDAAARGLFFDHHEKVIDSSFGESWTTTKQKPQARVAWSKNPGTCILDGLHQAAQHLIGDADAVLVLLGDVIWSRAALAKVVADPRASDEGVGSGRIFFAGTSELSGSTGEVYAMGWQGGSGYDPPSGTWSKRPGHDQMRYLLENAPCRRAVDGSTLVLPQAVGGHLRRLIWWVIESQHYLLATGLPPNAMWLPDYYLPIDDWTTDVDNDKDVAALPEVSAHCAAEVA